MTMINSALNEARAQQQLLSAGLAAQGAPPGASSASVSPSLVVPPPVVAAAPAAADPVCPKKFASETLVEMIRLASGDAGTKVGAATATQPNEPETRHSSSSRSSRV